jgi:tetratricopeptide (TPR) repeat protein
MSKPRLDKEQSKKARELFIGIIKELIDRSSELPFQRAWIEVFGSMPGRNETANEQASYCKLFKIDRHYIYATPPKQPKQFKHIASAHAALDLLGYKQEFAPKEEDPSSWITYLENVRRDVSENPPRQEEAFEPSDEVQIILGLLQTYGRAAIVGEAEQCEALAKASAHEMRRRGGWRIIDCNARDGLSLGSPNTAISKNYTSVWIDTLRTLVKTAKPKNDPSWKHLIHRGDDFLTFWGKTNRQGVDQLEPSERVLVNLLDDSKREKSRWEALRQALTDHGTWLRTPELIADIARIVQTGASKALVLVRNARDFSATQKTAEALFGEPSDRRAAGQLRLLVTSQQPDIFSFWESNEIKLTYYVGEVAPVADKLGSKPEPDGLILDDPRAEGERLRNKGIADSLKAKVQSDDFQERQADIEFLRRFIASSADDDRQELFRWVLVTGPAGDGKTRLAIQFLSVAESLDFRAGFLPPKRAEALGTLTWRPQRPTFIVIDYPGEYPDIVAALLRDFVSTAVKRGFEFPVRVLLLEREATGDWLKTIVPADSTGDDIRGYCYSAHEKSLQHWLMPLSLDALLSIMRGRLSNLELPDSLLLDALLRVDPNVRYDGSDWAPRPLFAAATAQAIADAVAAGDDAISIASKLEQADVLSRIIDREREHFWKDPYASHRYSHTEKHRSRLHENLLVVATIALDVSREKFEEECPEEARKYLPNFETLNEDRYRRMVGANSLRSFRRLEPDILGEFFVLDRLRKLRESDPREAQALIDAGLFLGGRKSARFIVRCAVDFEQAWRDNEFLKPTTLGPAILAFAAAALTLSEGLGSGRSDDVIAVATHAKELAEQCVDREVQELVWYALVKKGTKLRGEEAIAVFANIVNDTESKPELGELTALAKFHWAGALGALERNNEAIAIFDDLLAQMQPTTQVARELIAKTLFNKGVLLEKSSQPYEAMAAYEQMIDGFKTADETLLQVIAAAARVNRATLLDNFGRYEEALSACNDVLYALAATRRDELSAALDHWALGANDVDASGMMSDPEGNDPLEGALWNKGIVLGQLGRREDMIHAWDEFVQAYGAASNLRVRVRVAKALVSKGATLLAMRQCEGAIVVCDEVFNRFNAATEGPLREATAAALRNKGIAFHQLGECEQALGIYAQVVRLFGSAEELEMRKVVAGALHYMAIALDSLGRTEDANAIYAGIAEFFPTETVSLWDDMLQEGHVSVAESEPCPCGSGKEYRRCHGSPRD